MPHTQTIAMARGLLAEGRADDVLRMVGPLLDADTGGDGEDPAGVLMLRCLRARVRLLRAGDVPAVFDALGAYADGAARAALSADVRAETALWLGWAYAWQDPATFDDARARGLFDEAEARFREAHDASGRCWVGLGRARTFFALDEPGLMRRALDDVAALQDRLRDAEADLWAHDLRLRAARYGGAYAEAAAHHAALTDDADRLGDAYAAARARAYRAALDYDLGRPPEAVAAHAERAAAALRRHAVRPGVSLRVAVHTRVRALMRGGAWDEADRAADEGAAALADVRHGAAYLRLERARLATLRGDHGGARAHLDAVQSALSAPKHRRLAAAAALAEADLARRDGRPDDALPWAERAWLGARETDYEAQALRALLDLVDTHRALGRTDEARARLAEADRYAPLFALLPPAAYRFSVQGRLAAAAGPAEDAHPLFAQALAGYTLVGDVYGRACMQLAVAACDPDPAAARPLAAAARATFERLGCRADADRARALADIPAVDAPPPAADADRTLGSALARASLSAELVAEAWLQAAERLLPGAWIGVYRCGEDGVWTRVHDHNTAPEDLSYPSADEADAAVDGLRWVRLRPAPGPAFFFAAAADDGAWAEAWTRLKPWVPVARLALDHALLRARRLDAAPAADASPDVDLVVASPAMRDVAALVRRLHASHSPVLVTGEAGTGKGVVARALHAASERREAPFVVFNVAATPPELVERSLFGTAADTGDPSGGALGRAEGGTLLLVDVAELTAPLQRGLLRFLQTGEAFPVGAERPVARNVRLVSATSRVLAARVAEGRFREDLLHRLAVIPVHLPPLRERREEIPLLLRHFLDRLRAPGVPRPSVTGRAMDALLHYDWPGNVRQLRNEVERALALVSSEPAPTIDLAVLSPALTRAAGDGAVGTAPDVDARAVDRILQPEYDLDTLLAHTERALIERVLTAHGGGVTASADVLGLTRQGLYKKMKRLGIDPARFARPDAAPSSS